MAVPIQNLMHDQPSLVAISPNASLREAIDLMIENDFSQLPVVEGGRPYGIPGNFVTSDSIVRALRYFGTKVNDLRVRDALVQARTVSVDEDLFSKIDDLLEAYAALVLSPDGTIAGIITNYDTTKYFRQRAEDMLLVEDIESTLKDYVRAAFGGDENDPEGAIQCAIDKLSNFVDSIRDTCLKNFKEFCASKAISVSDEDFKTVIGAPFASTSDRTFDDLTLNEYIQLARQKVAWQVLGIHFGISDKAFLEMLDGVRSTRNKLMHFRPDVTSVERDHLRFCADWFKNQPPLSAEEGVDVPSLQESKRDPLTHEQDLTEIAEDRAPLEMVSTAEDESIESKYALWANYLKHVPQTLNRLIVPFSHIEEVLGSPLPDSARRHRSWWANDSISHVQSRQWLNVNWRVVWVNMTEEKVVFARARDRERAYINFFSQVRSKLRQHSEFPLHAANPTGANWIILAQFPKLENQKLGLSFALRQRLRLEFYIDTGNGEQNELLFNYLYSEQGAIEAAMGNAVEWERMEDKRASRVALYTDGGITDPSSKLEALVDWSVENAVKFQQALAGLVEFDSQSAPK